MNEDIETINKIFFKQAERNLKPLWFEIDYDDTQRLKQAIKNLIARNKEYEEQKKEINLNTEIRKLKDRIKDLEETNACLHETAKDEFIPKSKVKEKIEEYNKIREKADDSTIYTRMVDYIDVLQELLV